MHGLDDPAFGRPRLWTWMLHDDCPVLCNKKDNRFQYILRSGLYAWILVSTPYQDQQPRIYSQIRQANNHVFERRHHGYRHHAGGLP